MRITGSVRVAFAAVLLAVGIVSGEPLQESAVSPTMFMARHTEEPAVLRTKIALNAGYRSPKYWCLSVTAYSKLDKATSFAGFVKKGTPLAKRIIPYVEDGESRHALLKMRYDPEFRGSNECLVEDFAPAVKNGKSFVVQAEEGDDAATGDDAAPVEASVKFKLEQTRMTLVQGKMRDGVDGHPRLVTYTQEKRFKKPVLRVSTLVEAGGVRYCYQAILLAPRTYDGARQADIPATALRNGLSLADPEAISRVQVDVSREAWNNVTYGGTDASKTDLRRFFSAPKADKLKLLCYRIEVWQDGKVVVSYESDKNAWKRLDLPADWYEYYKYPDKLEYRARIGSHLLPGDHGIGRTRHAD